MARVKFTPRSGSGAPIKRLREDQSVGAQNEGENPTLTRRRTRSTTAINDEISNNVRCFNGLYDYTTSLVFEYDIMNIWG